MNRALVIGAILNLAWIVPTVIFAGAPVWACAVLIGFPLLFALGLALV